MIDIENIKKLREETGAGILETKEALQKNGGDYETAKKELVSKSSSKAAKKADRNAKDGLVYSYIHTGGKSGTLVLLACETDFVAKTDDFKKLCHEIALQVCAGDYIDVPAVLESEYIRDETKKVQDLINETIARVGEKIELKNFCKLKI